MKNYNFEKVINLFRKRYKLVPLEYFKRHPYKTLVSTILSARTKDEVTLIASKRLFNKAPNIKKLNLLGELEIRKLIYPVGFYRTKAKNLRKLARTIINDYKNSVPDSMDKLIKLPGVGRKTANLVLNRAFGKPAIAVDTHVHRISNLLGWVKTNTPEQTENELTKILPAKYWKDVNKLFVSIGRQFRSKTKLSEFLRKNKLV